MGGNGRFIHYPGKESEEERGATSSFIFREKKGKTCATGNANRPSQKVGQPPPIINYIFLFSFFLLQVLILQHGQLASNLTVGHGESSVILSNLEPFHTYQVQVNYSFNF